MSEEFISDEDSQSYNSEQPVFDIDQMSVNSENQQAIQYLQRVRDEAKQAPKCTYFEEGQDFQVKPTDPKYLIQPKGVRLNGKWSMNPLWQQDVIQQYYNFKQNIDQFRKLDQKSYQLLNFNLEQEEKIKSSLKKKCQFKEVSKDLTPTLFTFHVLDYQMASKIVKWLSLTQKCNYNQCLWIYCALTQLEDPLCSDTLANINKVLQNCYFVENGMTSVLITIIQLIFKQNYAD
ncbi:unnamed protein product [Paramecium sonneborni]|uniref:Gem-associated protein 2 n=1 Tax=Paramecium sonneborni TaxID=65129 RepID=A0A8S1PKV5_9CILI|nr:unnamed protein product [Paramecium sonneborni]